MVHLVEMVAELHRHAVDSRTSRQALLSSSITKTSVHKNFMSIVVASEGSVPGSGTGHLENAVGKTLAKSTCGDAMWHVDDIASKRQKCIAS